MAFLWLYKGPLMVSLRSAALLEVQCELAVLGHSNLAEQEMDILNHCCGHLVCEQHKHSFPCVTHACWACASSANKIL